MTVKEQIEAPQESPYPWTSVKHVPGTSVVNASTMLLDASGACIGMVLAINVRSEPAAMAASITQALGTAGDPAKTRRALQAARNGEAEANQRLEQIEAELAELRERIGRLHMRGGHQSWCALFGETVGWNDGLIHLIEPFVIKLYAEIEQELTRPFNDRERQIYKTMVRRALDAEAKSEGALAQVAQLKEALEKLSIERGVCWQPDFEENAKGWRQHVATMTQIARDALKGAGK